jgi:hypothetical protein
VSEILIRFVVGGLVVSAFALLSDMLKPKSFAGVFSAAPSVALATISLTVIKDGAPYAAMEARSMIAGAVSFLVYACVVSRVMLRGSWPALPVASFSLLIWVACAIGIWYIVLR